MHYQVDETYPQVIFTPELARN